MSFNSLLEMLKALAGAPPEVKAAFQFSIGDAVEPHRRIVYYEPVHLVSILYWRCSGLYVPVVKGETITCFNSLLEMLGLVEF